MVKQRSTALLLKVKPLDLDDVLKRNSSLDEKDYTDYVFTPSSELKSFPHESLSPLAKTDRKKLEPVDINRTFSLPPILEHTSKSHDNGYV